MALGRGRLSDVCRVRTVRPVAPRRPDARQERLTTRLLDFAQLGHAHWLFGNIYEAVVKVPDRLAAEHAARVSVDGRAASLFEAGSPVRYYVPAAPLTLAATFGAVITGWRTARTRRWLATAAASSMTGVAATAYLVRRVNLPLFFSADPPSPADRYDLVRTWHRVNLLRIAAAGVALYATHRARNSEHRGEPPARRLSVGERT
jgi:hypothetical protein